MRPNFNLFFLLVLTILFCSPSLFANGSVGKSSAPNNHSSKKATDKGKKLAVATYDVAPKLNTNHNPSAVCDLNLSLDLTVTGLHLNFTNQSVGNYSQMEWNFGDGSIAQSSNAQHTYEKAGMYYMTISIFDEQTGCMDFVGANIYVDETGKAKNFTQTDFQTGATLNLQ